MIALSSFSQLSMSPFNILSHTYSISRHYCIIVLIISSDLSFSSCSFPSIPIINYSFFACVSFPLLLFLTLFTFLLLYVIVFLLTALLSFFIALYSIFIWLYSLLVTLLFFLHFQFFFLFPQLHSSIQTST